MDAYALAGASVVVGTLSGTIATILAVLIGTASGYLGGNTDRTINAIVNVLMTLPGFALLFIIAGYVKNPGYFLINHTASIYENPVDFTLTAGVPEPAAWALMILGLGGVGATLRRERRRIASLTA